MASRVVSAAKNPVSRIPSGSNSRVRYASAIGSPVARDASAPSTWALVLYAHRSPGWVISGSEPSAASHVSGSGSRAGFGGPSVAVGSRLSATSIGQSSSASNISSIVPNPKVKVSRSRAVTGRAAGTVSSSGPSGRRSTLRFASSGSSRSTGSSSASSPSRTSARVSAPVTGLVVAERRNSESRCAGAPPMLSEPCASTCACSLVPTSATTPGTPPSATSAAACAAAISPKRASPSLVSRVRCESVMLSVSLRSGTVITVKTARDVRTNRAEDSAAAMAIRRSAAPAG